MDDDSGPSFTIKKRSKPRASTSSLRSSTTADQPAQQPTATTNDDDDNNGNVAVFRSRGKKTPAGRVKDREATGAKARARVSFGGDDEDDADSDASLIKRSTPTSTPRRLLHPTLPSTASSTSLASPAPAVAAAPTRTAEASPATRSTYSKEYLDELKRGQLSAPRAAAPVDGDGAPGFDDLTKSKFGDDQLEDSTIFPSSDSIARAKARREEMRKAGISAPARGDDGFVPLEVGFAHKGGDSRLVREEDELGDGDDDMAAFTDSLSRLPLGKRANAAAARALRAEMGDMIDDVEMDVRDDDAEMREWEEAQIRRGGEGRRTTRDEGAVKGKGKGPYRPAPIPQSSTLPSLAAVSARLSAAITTLTSSHTLDTGALAHFEQERADLDKQERELRDEVERVERKSRWFDEFKEQVEDWSAFLDEKFPQLEKIEAEYLAIQRERYNIVSQRRYADDADDVALFTGVAIPSLFRPPPPSDAPPPADDALALDAAESPEDLAPRSHARNMRRQARTARHGPSSSAYPDALDSAGYASDSSLSPSHLSDLSAALSAQQDALAGLFADVKAADFRDPNLGIRRRFEEWRERFGEEYEMTFAGLSLVQVWEFWARVEMAAWNPFEIDELPRTVSDLSAYQWHQNLSSYGHRERSGDEHQDEQDDDEDKPDESAEVVNALVTSVVIPRLEKLARAAYDPYSSRQTVAALRVVDEVSYCVETSSPKFESLIHAFLHRLRLSIAQLQHLILPHLSALSLPSLAFDPSTFVARQHVLHRALKLVRTCARWRRFMRALRVPALPVEIEGGVLEVGAGATYDELVQRELVGRTVLPVLEAAWATGGAEVANKFIEALPKDMPPALRRRFEGEEAGARR
ncbi:hypothetical protein JCM9279_002539 [Rhodotorula babjevae]